MIIIKFHQTKRKNNVKITNVFIFLFFDPLKLSVSPSLYLFYMVLLFSHLHYMILISFSNTLRIETHTLESTLKKYPHTHTQIHKHINAHYREWENTTATTTTIFRLSAQRRRGHAIEKWTTECSRFRRYHEGDSLYCIYSVMCISNWMKKSWNNELRTQLRWYLIGIEGIEALLAVAFVACELWFILYICEFIEECEFHWSSIEAMLDELYQQSMDTVK